MVDQGSADQRPAPPRILVIEDDPLLLDHIVAVLEREGYRAVGEPDGRHGLARLRREPIELVVTDLLMPGNDGIEVLQHMRASAPAVPVIVMSASFAADNPYRAIVDALGAAALVAKPLDETALVAAVRAALSRAGR